MSKVSTIYIAFLLLTISCSQNKQVRTEIISEETSGSFVDERDGKEYKWVAIGGKIWMAQNLAYTPELCPPGQECGFWILNIDDTLKLNNPTSSDLGTLYSFTMAKKACPDGWHLPSSKEWRQLEGNLGMSNSDAIRISGMRGAGSGVAGNMRDPNGFNAKHEGRRTEEGSFESDAGYWWANEEYGTMPRTRALARRISNDHAGIDHYDYDKKNGFSVRCKKGYD